MNFRHQLGKSSAFSRLELVIVILILAVLVVLLIPAFSNARAKAQRIRCASHLKGIGISMKVWANDHGDKFPMRASTNTRGSLDFAETGQVFRHFQAASNETYSTETLTCPSDSRRRARDWPTLNNSNVSYFIGLDADETSPQFLLAGDRHLDGTPPKARNLLLSTTNTSLTWGPELHGGMMVGNVGLSDGSAHQLAGPGLTRYLLIGVTNAFTNRLEFP